MHLYSVDLLVWSSGVQADKASDTLRRLKGDISGGPHGIQMYVRTLFRRRNLWIHAANSRLVQCAVARRPTPRRAEAPSPHRHGWIILSAVWSPE